MGETLSFLRHRRRSHTTQFCTHRCPWYVATSGGSARPPAASSASRIRGASNAPAVVAVAVVPCSTSAADATGTGTGNTRVFRPAAPSAQGRETRSWRVVADGGAAAAAPAAEGPPSISMDGLSRFCRSSTWVL